MTDLHAHQLLSRIELMALARLSAPRAPLESEIAKSLRQVGLPHTDIALADSVKATLAALQRRALIAPAPVASVTPVPSSSKRSNAKRTRKPKKTSQPRFVLTESGRLALCDALALAAAPTWEEMRDCIAPLLALGEQPGSKSARAALGSAVAMTVAFLRRDRTLGAPTKVPELCDQLIARALGMPPGPVTLAGIRAYALARNCGIDTKAELEQIAAKFTPVRLKKLATLDRELETLAARLAKEQLGAEVKTKPTMLRALLRYWVSQQDEGDSARRSTALRLPFQTSAPEDTPSSRVAAGIGDALLSAIHDAMPRIGSDGRYGKENVFVSALWQRIATDRRVPDLSFDDFKQWLVDANRDQLLALACADLVDDMDSRLVEDSKIEDLGATFHFVIDRNEPSSSAMPVHHAR